MKHYIITALRFTPTQIFGFLWLFIIITPISIPIVILIVHTNRLKRVKEKGRKAAGTVIEKKFCSQEKHKQYRLFISYTGDDGANHLATVHGDTKLKDVEVGQSIQIIYVPGKYKTIALADEYRI